MLRFALRRLISSVIVLLLIGYLSFLAQAFAAGTRSGSPLSPMEAARLAAGDGAQLIAGLMRGEWATYDAGSRSVFVAPTVQPMNEIVGPLLVNSVALLVLAMIVGGTVGGAIGVAAAAVRRPGFSLGLVMLSILGISTPSFFLGMLLQYLEISFYKTTGIRLVPVGGFGWDEHLILPVLVLAARPIAQVARLTYVRVTAALDEDYVRTAHAKGLRPRGVWSIHIAPNVASTVLTAMGTSLRFSLSSLPVVEYMFGWPGAGRTMLTMLRTGQRGGATILVMAMGAFFIAVNLLLDVVYRAADPRLRDDAVETGARAGWWDWVRGLLSGLGRAITFRRRRRSDARLSPEALRALAPSSAPDGADPAEEAVAAQRQARRRAWVQATAGNPALLLGAMVGLALAALVVFGPGNAPRDPYAFAPMLEIDGRSVRPPVPPSDLFPLGSDAQGRDVLSLLMAGARRTLAIALFAVVARLLVGGFLGFIAGWFAGSRLDRAIMGISETVSAFPALLLAMLVVYAVGVRQGLVAFVVALAVVGWGEVMQTVRSQVMAIRPTAYIEGAVAAGVGEGQILSAHVLPNVWPTMVSLAFLEMGGALMILGELGFLGVFIGGGFAADGEALPNVVYYDVPEWSVMLANSWRHFRSYPWATLYPALAFFVAIAGFTFLGEGLRRFTERLTLSLRTLFNRYTLLTGVLLVVGVNWMFQSTGFAARLAPAADAFDTERALADIEYLAHPELNGRLSGTADADRVAEWIAAEFERLGLQAAGQDGTYYQHIVEHYRDLAGQPTLTLRGPASGAEAGAIIEARYGIDYVRDVAQYDVGGSASGEIVLVAERPGYVFSPETVASVFGISVAELARDDRLLLRLSATSAARLTHVGHSALLTMSRQPLSSSRYELLGGAPHTVGARRPTLLVSYDLVSRLLAASGQTVETMARRIPHSASEPAIYYPTGWTAELDVPFEMDDAATARNVVAYWPGDDVVLDAEVVMVTAFYDGLGRGPDGTLYPGANDNASGVAVMLETIRTLKEQGFRPRRTLIFVAWIGGERHRPVEYEYYLRAHPAFADAYTIVAGIELEGVGAGTGSSAVLQHATSSRLTESIQRAARQMRTPLSTSERGLHADDRLFPTPSTKVPSVTVSWAGADALAHTAADTAAAVDPTKLGQVGRLVSLAAMVLSTDPAY